MDLLNDIENNFARLLFKNKVIFGLVILFYWTWISVHLESGVFFCCLLILLNMGLDSTVLMYLILI